MKKLFIILIIIYLSKNVFASNFFDSQLFEIEFNSFKIEKTKIEKINEIKKISIKNILKNTLTKKQFNNIDHNLSDDLINTFIKNIIIDDEKIINNKYHSKIKINFNKNTIINYFREKNLPYVEFYPNNLLLIIYEKDNLNKNLFSLNNKFYNYFDKTLPNHHLFQIPNLDINDRYSLKIDDLINKNFKKIKKFSKKYNSEDIIIIIADVVDKNVNYNLLLYSNNDFVEKKLIFYKYDLKLFFKYLEEETLDIWKNLNQIQNNNLNSINCNISYYNLLELKEIRINLLNTSIIENLNIKSLNFKNIDYNITYYGNLKILKKILKSNKLKININDDFCKIGLI